MLVYLSIHAMRYTSELLTTNVSVQIMGHSFVVLNKSAFFSSRFLFQNSFDWGLKDAGWENEGKEMIGVGWRGNVGKIEGKEEWGGDVGENGSGRREFNGSGDGARVSRQRNEKRERGGRGREREGGAERRRRGVEKGQVDRGK